MRPSNPAPKGVDTMPSIECSNCLHKGSYEISQMIYENDVWHLICSMCGHKIFTVSTTERDQIIQGMHLTEQYVPDIKNAYKSIDHLSNTVKFGRILEEIKINIENNTDQSLKIRPLTTDDFETVLNWSKDDNFCLANGWETNRNEEELHQWWIRCVNHSIQGFIRMGIEWNEKLIGYVDLACIKNNTAELGIAIGESTLWGKGIGYNSAMCMIDFASKELDITVFDAETHETNIRSRKMLEKIGFKEISRNGTEVYLGVESQLIRYRLTL
jgi:[ribosomal protein S5]-alanine N-acetyltransferase